MDLLGPNPVLMQHPQQGAARVGCKTALEARDHCAQQKAQGLQPPGLTTLLSEPTVHAPKHAQELPT